MRFRCFAFLGLLASGCVASQPYFSATRLAEWTTALRDSQSDQPFLLVYRRGGQRLIFVAVEHDNDPGSKTFGLIGSAFGLWPADSLIVEGASTSAGPNPHSLVGLASEPLDAQGLQPNGETVPAVRAALAARASIWGGEASDADVMARARLEGVAEQDALGFYTLRVVPQWLRDGTVARPDDPKLAPAIARQLLRSRRGLGLSDTILPDYAAWTEWYRRINGKPIEAGLDNEEVGPLADGRWPTNRIAWSVAKARDGHLLGLIEERLAGGRSVVVVFGGSHALILRPALDSALGSPCYVGGDPVAAKRQCLT